MASLDEIMKTLDEEVNKMIADGHPDVEPSTCEEDAMIHDCAAKVFSNEKPLTDLIDINREYIHCLEKRKKKFRMSSSNERDEERKMIAEKMKLVDDAIMRKKMIADGHSDVKPFTTEENMMIYDCVYKLCTLKPPMDHSIDIYLKYVNCLAERIGKKVLPALVDKQGISLLVDTTKLWSEFQAFAQSLSKLLVYVDRHKATRLHLSLSDAPKQSFYLVFDKLFGKLKEATMSLIIQEREGKQIDKDLLKTVLDLFLEVGGKRAKNKNYYKKLEQAMLAEAAAYYAQLSLEWWFWRDSYANYLRKVDWCFIQEEARAKLYPVETTKTELLGVMKYILLERNARKLAELRSIDSHNIGPEDRELVAKYASLSLGDDLSTADSVEPTGLAKV